MIKQKQKETTTTRYWNFSVSFSDNRQIGSPCTNKQTNVANYMQTKQSKNKIKKQKIIKLVIKQQTEIK